MSYFKKISSLKEKASYQVAIDLCQDMCFKEIAMCLEKPTYGLFHFDRGSLYFIGGTKISFLSMVKDSYNKSSDSDLSLYKLAEDKLGHKVGDKLNLWNVAVEEQCQRLTKRLPSSLKHEVHVWIQRIAFEYLSYSRRQELLFGVSRYFLMDFLTQSDWMEDSRLNEMKLAKRLLRDERLTIMQRYQIACVYCLRLNILQFWYRLTQEEKQSIWCGHSYDQQNEFLVCLWTEYMNRYSSQRRHLWSLAAQKSVHYGNQTALISCWKRLSQRTQQQLIVHMALEALNKWRSVEHNDPWRRKLISNKYRSTDKRPEHVKHFNLPSYYCEMMRFFLSKMNEKQKLLFFRSAFETGDEWYPNYSNSSILECFLDWPLLDFFLSTMNLLWGMIPMKIYGQCLQSLARRRFNCKSYDYESILLDLWTKTPQDYKQYVLCHKNQKNDGSYYTVISYLFLNWVSYGNPFPSKDVPLFKQIWCDLPQEEKKTILCSSIGGRVICKLAEKEKWSLLDWMMKESVPNKEIQKFKKQFIKSNYYCIFCKLDDNCEDVVEKVIDWCFQLDSDKTQYKCELINSEDGMSRCSSYLEEGNFAKVERMIHFCLNSDDEMKRKFQFHVVKNSCRALFKNCLLEQIDEILAWHFKTEDEIKKFKRDKDIFNMDVLKKNCCKLLKSVSSSSNPWKQVDKILAWNFNAEEEIEGFKKDLFNSDGINIHYYLVFSVTQWEKVQCFYEWFCLSSQEIIKIKKETIFADNVIEMVHRALYKDVNDIFEPLQWCITDKEMAVSFGEKLEKQYFEKVEENRVKDAKSCLDNLVSELLRDLIKDKKGKRCVVIEDEYSSGISYKYLKKTH